MSPPRSLARGRWLELVDDNGWEFVRRVRGHAVAIILPRFTNGDTLLVEQYRPAVGRPCIEFPAGLVGDEPGMEAEALLQAAGRELLEETGYRAHRLRWLFRGPTTPGMSSEQVDFILAEDLQHEHAGGGVDDENITVHRLPLATLPQWLATRSNCCIDAKLHAGLWWLLHAERD